MKITVELPDDTVAGFVNYVFVEDGLKIGSIALDSDRIKTREVTWEVCEAQAEKGEMK